MDRLTLFIIGLAGILLLCGVAVWLWRRFYRDDDNAARRIVKNSAVPFVARLVVRALDMVFFVVLLGTLPAAEIGPYTVAALLVAQYLGTITDFGLGVLLTREVARDPQAAQKLFGITLLIRLLLVVLLAVPLAQAIIGMYDLLAALGVGEAITPVGQQAIWVLLLTLPPSAYAGAVTALFHANERMEVPALIELVTAIISLIARIAVLLLGFGIVGLAWAAVGVSTFTALIFFWLQVRTFFAPMLQWDWTQARALLWLAFPLMLNNLLNVVFFRFDIFIIKAFGEGQGELLVQQYAVPYQILNIALILPPVVTFAVFPLLARRAANERAALAEAQNRTLQVLLLLAFPITVGTAVLAPDLIAFFARDNASDYLPISAEVLAILAWFLPLSFVNGLLQYVLIAINRQAAITRAFVIGAAFNLSSNLLLIPQFGLYAASVITILSEVVLLLVFWPLLRREGLAPPLLRLMWRPLLAALLMGAAMLAMAPLGWLVAALLAAPIYGAALWLLGAFGAEEMALARRVLGRA
ncbi:MAG: flippase [Chloroflexaceae bacterium]|nr:flippase [Chloroflexaceae bacterium]